MPASSVLDPIPPLNTTGRSPLAVPPALQQVLTLPNQPRQANKPKPSAAQRPPQPTLSPGGWRFDLSINPEQFASDAQIRASIGGPRLALRPKQASADFDNMVGVLHGIVDPMVKQAIPSLLSMGVNAAAANAIGQPIEPPKPIPPPPKPVIPEKVAPELTPTTVAPPTPPIVGAPTISTPSVKEPLIDESPVIKKWKELLSPAQETPVSHRLFDNAVSMGGIIGPKSPITQSAQPESNKVSPSINSGTGKAFFEGLPAPILEVDEYASTDRSPSYSRLPAGLTKPRLIQEHFIKHPEQRAKVNLPYQKLQKQEADSARLQQELSKDPEQLQRSRQALNDFRTEMAKRHTEAWNKNVYRPTNPKADNPGMRHLANMPDRQMFDINAKRQDAPYLYGIDSPYFKIDMGLDANGNAIPQVRPTQKLMDMQLKQYVASRINTDEGNNTIVSNMSNIPDFSNPEIALQWYKRNGETPFQELRTNAPGEALVPDYATMSMVVPAGGILGPAASAMRWGFTSAAKFAVPRTATAATTKAAPGIAKAVVPASEATAAKGSPAVAEAISPLTAKISPAATGPTASGVKSVTPPPLPRPGVTPPPLPKMPPPLPQTPPPLPGVVGAAPPIPAWRNIAGYVLDPAKGLPSLASRIPVVGTPAKHILQTALLPFRAGTGGGLASSLLHGGRKDWLRQLGWLAGTGVAGGSSTFPADFLGPYAEALLRTGRAIYSPQPGASEYIQSGLDPYQAILDSDLSKIPGNVKEFGLRGLKSLGRHAESVGTFMGEGPAAGAAEQLRGREATRKEFIDSQLKKPEYADKYLRNDPIVQQIPDDRRESFIQQMKDYPGGLTLDTLQEALNKEQPTASAASDLSRILSELGKTPEMVGAAPAPREVTRLGPIPGAGGGGRIRMPVQPRPASRLEDRPRLMEPSMGGAGGTVRSSDEILGPIPVAQKHMQQLDSELGRLSNELSVLRDKARPEDVEKYNRLSMVRQDMQSSRQNIKQFLRANPDLKSEEFVAQLNDPTSGLFQAATAKAQQDPTFQQRYGNLPPDQQNKIAGGIIQNLGDWKWLFYGGLALSAIGLLSSLFGGGDDDDEKGGGGMPWGPLLGLGGLAAAGYGITGGQPTKWLDPNFRGKLWGEAKGLVGL